MSKLRLKRKKRVRSRVSGTKDVPRLAVFRSNRGIYAQIVDDSAHRTLASFSEGKLGEAKGTGLERAFSVGTELARESLKKKIKKVVFDRAGYRYHGRVKALAEGARKGGLIF